MRNTVVANRRETEHHVPNFWGKETPPPPIRKKETLLLRIFSWLLLCCSVAFLFHSFFNPMFFLVVFVSVCKISGSLFVFFFYLSSSFLLSPSIILSSFMFHHPGHNYRHQHLPLSSQQQTLNSALEDLREEKRRTVCWSTPCFPRGFLYF